MISACGLELSTDTETASVAIASRADGARKYEVNLAYYGPADGAVAEVAGVYAATESCGLFCDPAQVAGLLDGLRAAGVWLHLLTTTEVAAASYLFKEAVRGRRVRTSGHEALKAAMQYAVRRPLSAAFAFERRKVPADMSALNAACFGYFGLRRNEGTEAEPGVWWIEAGEPEPERGETSAPGGWQPPPDWIDGVPPWVQRG